MFLIGLAVSNHASRDKGVPKGDMTKEVTFDDLDSLLPSEASRDDQIARNDVQVYGVICHARSFVHLLVLTGSNPLASTAKLRPQDDDDQKDQHGNDRCREELLPVHPRVHVRNLSLIRCQDSLEYHLL